MQLDKVIGKEIPYYNMMKKAMSKQKKSKKKAGYNRLTEVDLKSKKPRLRKGVNVQRAIEVLYMFENTEVTPKQIEEMRQTIDNQRKRIMKLEDWRN